MTLVKKKIIPFFIAFYEHSGKSALLVVVWMAPWLYHPLHEFSNYYQVTPLGNRAPETCVPE